MKENYAKFLDSQVERELRRRYDQFFDLCRIKIESMTLSKSIEDLSRDVDNLEALDEDELPVVDNFFKVKYYG